MRTNLKLTFLPHFPLRVCDRWFIPLRMQSKAQGRIFSLFDLERISEDELESKVYENAKDGLTILSNKLGVVIRWMEQDW